MSTIDATNLQIYNIYNQIYNNHEPNFMNQIYFTSTSSNLDRNTQILKSLKASLVPNHIPQEVLK